jgi:predicted dienelactone hydrolase
MRRDAPHLSRAKPFVTALLAAATFVCTSLVSISALAADEVSAAQAVDARVVTLDLDWTDTRRSRPVPARLYLPEGAKALKPVPLVVFSHGIGGSRMGYSYLGRFWASQGYASLHVQHVGSDSSVWMGNPLGLVGRLHGAAQDEEAVARVLDIRFALDQLLAGNQGARIDAHRIVAAGHSYGANSVMLAIGAQVDRAGEALQLHDERIKAAILLSAPPFYGRGNPAPILSKVSVPTLHITATDDVIKIPGYHSGVDDREALFEATGDRRKVLAIFTGGSHSMFTDRTRTGGSDLNAQVKQATRELSLAFLQQVFDGQDAGLRAWPGAHAGIVSRFTRPSF